MKKGIHIKNLDYSYVKGTQILSDISFSIENEIACILAPTGAGKTTLLNIISGIVLPNKGVVSIEGFSPLEAIRNKKVGYSFQDSTLLEWKTVMDNVLLPLQIGEKREITINELGFASELIKLVGLSDFENYKCSNLSGGMKQRVSLARALITNPDIILFDEPFSKLDFITKTTLLIEFRKILNKRKVSCALVTHSIEDAVLIGDKVLVFSKDPFILKSEIRINLEERDVKTLRSDLFLKKVLEIKQIIYDTQ